MKNRYEILKECAKKESKGAKVSDYVMGIGLCAVNFDDGRAGVAYTDRRAIPWGCSLYDDLPKTGIDASEFIDMFDSNDTLMKSLGAAAINASLNRGEFRTVDVMEEVSLTKSDTVGMVGYFDPMVEDIRNRSKKLYIFEKENMHDTLRPEKMPEIVPECDVLLISATTVINGSFDSVVEHARTERIVMIGPSTPICEEAFPEVMIFGATVVVPEALRVIARGGGTRNLYRAKAGKKVVLISGADHKE